MAEIVTLAPVSSFTNDSSAVATVNANSTLITTAFADCLSLSGEQPNQMQSNLDMGQFQVINLPPPATLNSPVRLTDLANITNSGTITVNTLPAGGSSNALLHKNSSTDYDATWTLTPSGLTSIGATTSTVTTSNITGTAVLSGSSSGTTTLQASATASGTLTLPAATDTLTGKATTDTLTNKTFDTAGTGNVFKAGGVTTSTVTGTGAIVLANTPTLITPVIGVATGTSLTVSGVLKSSGATSGVGYATGAGGTVSQGTSKSTAVTLNTMSGQITMFATGAISAGVANAATFTLSNSNIASTDLIIVNHSSGGTAGAYLPWADTIAGGSCKINVANITAGGLTEAPVISFAIIKGVTS